MNNIWFICRFSNGEYIGQNKNYGGFIRVGDINEAYLAVEGELEESAEELCESDDFEILKVRVIKENKITIIKGK